MRMGSYLGIKKDRCPWKPTRWKPTKTRKTRRFGYDVRRSGRKTTTEGMHVPMETQAIQTETGKRKRMDGKDGKRAYRPPDTYLTRSKSNPNPWRNQHVNRCDALSLVSRTNTRSKCEACLLRVGRTNTCVLLASAEVHRLDRMATFLLRDMPWHPSFICHGRIYPSWPWRRRKDREKVQPLCQNTQASSIECKCRVVGRRICVVTIVSTMRVSFSDIEGSMPLSGCDGFADERDIRFLVSTIRSNPLIRRMGPIRLVGFDLIFSLRWFVALLRSLVGIRRLRGARRETGLVLFFPTSPPSREETPMGVRSFPPPWMDEDPLWCSIDRS